MRVLHLQKASGVGGSERHLLHLLPGLQRAGVDVQIGVAMSGQGNRFVTELRSAGIETFTTPAGHHANPRLIGWARRAIRDFRPDIVHTHLIHADLYGQLAARLEAVPGISSAHGTPPFLRRQPVAALSAAVGRMPRLTIAISGYVQRFLEQHRLLRPGTARVVYYGLDAAGWTATQAQRADARAQLGLEPDELAVAMTARVIEGKGHHALVEAVAAARQRVHRLRIVIAGEGPLRADLERHAHTLVGRDGALLLGFVDDVRPVLWGSDVLAFPTEPGLGEGFGLSALEAMAAERPVLATAVGALPEVVATHESGILVPPGRPRALADALVELAQNADLRTAMGQAGRQRVERLFGVDTMVDRTLAVYDEALASSAR